MTGGLEVLARMVLNTYSRIVYRKSTARYAQYFDIENFATMRKIIENDLKVQNNADKTIKADSANKTIEADSVKKTEGNIVT